MKQTSSEQPSGAPGVAEPARLAVVGAGAWGTVLALLLSANHHRVTLLARRPEHAAAMTKTRENRPYLPGVRLPETLAFSSDPAAIYGSDAAFVAVPSRGLRQALQQLPPLLALISGSKGLELGTFARVTEIIAEYQPEAQLAALSGPNLAGEIAEGKPAAATVASRHEGLARAVQRWLQQPRFRVYRSDDIVGVEVAGALKNVIALAAGICDGLELGDNAKASIITRGLAELVRLGTRLGGRERTFYGLAGVGDIIATCSSSRSRNHTAGVRIARGDTLAALRAAHLTAEGIPTVEAVHAYAAEQQLELPIAAEVYRVVFEGKAPAKAIDELMMRAVKEE